MAKVATASSLVQKIGDFSIVDTCRVCSNKRSGKNKCNHDKPKSMAEFISKHDLYVINIDMERNCYMLQT